jgi:hypothetical protein
VYNLNSGRAEQDSPFPSDTGSFLGLDPLNISLTSAGEVCIYVYKIVEVIRALWNIISHKEMQGYNKLKKRYAKIVIIT